ncbi:MAG: hypothetical protein NZ899_07940 [Thermoguttaceae bacterium]|nr:hypothetical protein [Thermoguttaceae bacterium]MDW8078125.1 hypothetical protein [Thermoguttaceae bacterium]
MHSAAAFFSSRSSTLRTSLESLAVAFVVAMVLFLTASDLPMVWDEGNAIWRAEGISAWFKKLTSTPPSKWSALLSREEIAHYWRYTVTLEGHPTFYGIVIAVGRALAPPGWPPWQQARFGPILLFAATAGCVYGFFASQLPRQYALGAVVGILFLPHVFAHLHFATPDNPLCSLWLLTWMAYCSASSGSLLPGQPAPLQQHAVSPCRQILRLLIPARKYIPFAILLGLTLATKFTGWVAPLPFLLWTIISARIREILGLAFGLALALAVFVLVNPPIWHDPLSGLIEFWMRNLDRSAYNVSIYFFGRRYDLYHPLPWYNTIAWLLVTVPTFLLFCLFLGLIFCWRYRGKSPWVGPLILNMASLLVVRATPWAPPHDGIRLFLPSVAFVGIVAGLGLGHLIRITQELCKRKSQAGRSSSRLVAAFGLATFSLIVVAGCALNLWCYHPHWLSFYNALIGGPVGAQNCGLEVTYYWDALTPEVIDWLKQNTLRGEKVQFAAGPHENLILMQRWGYFPLEFRPERPGQPRWYVLQHRFGLWQPEDWWLVHNRKPAFSKTLFGRKSVCGHKDVVLLSVFDWQDYLEAKKATQAPTGP